MPGIPYSQHPSLSVRQTYENVGVQEGIHYLQLNSVKGLLLPNRNILHPDSGLLDYWRQPEKVEALHYSGLFFQQKYGKNPFAPAGAFYKKERYEKDKI